MIRRASRGRAAARGGFLAAALLGLVLASVTPAAADGGRAAQERGGKPPWRELTFSAAKWLNRVTTRIVLDEAAAGQALAEAVAAGEGEPLAPAGAVVGRVTVQTVIEPAFGDGARLVERFFFDPAGPTVLFGERLRTGADEYLRRFRFTRQGAFRRRREPASSQEAGGPPSGWSSVKSSFYPFDAAGSGCAELLVPAMLIDAVRGFDLAGGQRCYCVFHKRHLFRVCLKPAGRRPQAVDYTLSGPRATERRSGQVDAVALRMTARPLGNYRGEVVDFSFLGFKRDVVLWIDPTERLPVAIGGVIPTLGQVMLRLSAAAR